MIIEMLALALFAQDGNKWERGTDEITHAGGIRHVASGIFVTCVPQSGTVHITMDGQPAYRLRVEAGDLEAKVIGGSSANWKTHMMFDAADPALEAVATSGTLKVGRHDLGFSDRDRAQYKLLVTRICRKPAQ